MPTLQRLREPFGSQRLGVVPENLGLFDNLTGCEYLTFIGRMYLLPREVVRERTGALLAMMELANEEKKLVLEYSHGMRKKLALAAAFLVTGSGPSSAADTPARSAPDGWTTAAPRDEIRPAFAYDPAGGADGNSFAHVADEICHSSKTIPAPMSGNTSQSSLNDFINRVSLSDC